MTFSENDYNQLIAAIALGAVRVKYSDKEVEYRSLNEMKSLANTIARDLNKDIPFPTVGARVKFAFYQDGR